MTNFYNALNAYSDATQNSNGDICCGYIITLNREIIMEEYNVFVDQTSGFGEIFGLYMAIRRVLDICYYYPSCFLNVFSDSLSSVKAVTEYSQKWYGRELHKELNNIKKNPNVSSEEKEEKNIDLIVTTLKKTNGKKVKDDDILYNIISLITFYKENIHIFHVPSHHNPNNEIDISNFIQSFITHNHMYIDDITAREMIYFNSIIDSRVKQHLQSTVTNPDFNPDKHRRPIPIFRKIISNDLLCELGKLVAN